MSTAADNQRDGPSGDEATDGKWRFLAQHLAYRTAEKQAAFFLPYLRPGMELLDCGCGPGTITVGLAGVVAPGRVVGIDLEARQIEQARTHPVNQAAANLSFEVGSIYEIPFPDNSFDAVFVHAVLIHLSDPVAALREIYRVLRPNGVIGVRDADFAGYLLAPEDSVVAGFWPLVGKMVQRKGGNAYRGRQLRSLLRRAGFSNIQATASYDAFGTAEGIQHWAGVIIGYLHTEKFVREAQEFGLATRADLENLADAYQAWAINPDAFHASAFCEAVGWKE